MPLLELHDVGISFGGIRAVNSVSFDVHDGELKAIVGPNGAGKTTIFNMITGVYRRFKGTILFNNRVISGLPAYRIASLGISRTFQQSRVIGEMTVLENVLVGCHPQLCTTYLDAAFRLRRHRESEKSALQKAMECLDLVGLSDLAAQPASQLPVGKERLLQVARAMAMQPKLLLLDEPAAGLNDLETANLASIIKRINSQGITVLLVEHNMNLVMGISHAIVVLNYGEKIAEGSPQEVQNNAKVIEAYLGTGQKGARLIC